jgi:hypothetical protein
MDGQFYNDLLKPHNAVSVTSVTLAATNKALYPVANIPAMGKDYWWVGKKIRIQGYGQMTTAATPGNLTVAVFYGTGADANGTSIVASAAQTLIASQTNISWAVDLTIHCRAIGTSGSLLGWGLLDLGAAVSAAGGGIMPASAPAAVTVDLTVASNVLSLQALRSGSTAETMQVIDMAVFALN